MNVLDERSIQTDMYGLWPSGNRPAASGQAAVDARAVHAFEALTQRAKPGTFVYLAICVGYGLCITGLGAVALPAVLLATISAVRFTFLVRTPARMPRDPVAWHRKFRALALVSIVATDGFIAWQAWIHRLDAGSIALVAASCGIQVGASHALSPDRVLAVAFATLGRLPLFIGLLAIGTSLSNFVFGLTLIQTAYGVTVCKQLNREFWEMRRANETLALAHRELQDEVAARERMETQLRLSQKLEAVGRLAAGIAHEINTPLQASMSSLQFIRDGLPDVLAHAERGRHEDADYVLDNLPSAIEVANDGLERTAEIVRSIKQLAHPGSEDKRPFDLAEIMRSTLGIARHEYANIADVELRVEDLPAVQCHASELSQVFLNILLNAAQAIATGTRGARGRIVIAMKRVGTDVQIEIADNGPGIPAHAQPYVFDPFFTTKQVGMGTGQGLAIARSIVVNRHGGEIAFTTSAERGTAFTITVPIEAAVPVERHAA